MRIITSKDKVKVLRWATKAHREWLWKDSKEVWHAATTRNHVPTRHAEVEQVPGLIGKELEWPSNFHIGKQLAFFRENAGMTQAEVARLMSKK